MLETGERERMLLGRGEWVALPDLGLPAIKAKIDTGARTSALHAFLVEPFGPISAPKVRFGVHPIPGRRDIEIFCSAPIVDRRDVTSSNGESESRYVIMTRVRLGTRDWVIEVTLANRENMAWRMLLGRQAIGDALVDANQAFRQPRLSYRLYRHIPREQVIRRPLRLALLSGRTTSPSIARLAAAARLRGHELEHLDPQGLQLGFLGPHPGLILGDSQLPHFDAVLPRLTRAAGGWHSAVVRQLELMGSLAINSGDALDRLRNPWARSQWLSRAGVPTPFNLLSAGREVSEEEATALRAAGRSFRRVLVLNGRAIAALAIRQGRAFDGTGLKVPRSRRIAEKAASALRLSLCHVDVATGDAGPEVIGVSALPPLALFEDVTGVQVAEPVIAHVERAVRSWVRRADADAPADQDEDASLPEPPA